MTNDSTIHYYGIDGATGQPSIPPLTVQELAAAIRQLKVPENLRDLKRQKRRSKEELLGLPEGVSPCRLDTAGWGLVFAEDADPAIEEALSELVDHRRNQAGDMFRVFKGPTGVRRDQAKNEWLTDQGLDPAEVEPDKVPYYLLLVGSPESISFQFQRHLGVDYAVGRIHFNTLQEYANYARSVVLAETRKRTWLPRRIAFYGAVNGDSETQIMDKGLIIPVSETISKLVATDLSAEGGLADPALWPGPCPEAAGVVNDWQVETYTKGEATRGRLLGLLGEGGRAPALLFAGGHGYETKEVACMPFEQGALISSDWDSNAGPVPRDSFVSGEDITGDANMLGMIAFFFACYSAGTPSEADEILDKINRLPAVLPPYPFIARLPAKMLGAPAGGALAVIASVAPTFSPAFQWPDDIETIAPFDECMSCLLRGYPIGHAIRPFAERYASHAVTLADHLKDIRKGAEIPHPELVYPWLTSYLSGNQIIIGDPAVRMSPTTTKVDAELPAFKPKVVAGAPQTDSRPDAPPDECN